MRRLCLLLFLALPACHDTHLGQFEESPGQRQLEIENNREFYPPPPEVRGTLPEPPSHPPR